VKPQQKQSMSFDDLGDRMKMYEGQEAARHFIPRLPIVARLDGKAFHSFTRGLEQPFDARLMVCMVETAIHLVKFTNARIAYRQSDEITLIWPGQMNRDDFWFAGRVQKMNSLLAATATNFFNKIVAKKLPANYADKDPLFDCRVWQVPDETEAVNTLVWRENDAVKNSIMAHALHCVGHKTVLGQDQKAQLDFIHGKGQNWNDNPDWAKRGTYVMRQRTRAPFTTEEFDALPAKHYARTNPDLIVERVKIDVLEMPRITSIANRNEVFFHGATPLVSIQGESS